MSKSNQSKSYLSSEQSSDWLTQRMKVVGISSLEELAKLTDIDRGTLSRYFRQERRPSIDAIAPICEALKVSPESLLIGLGAIKKK
jgi:transcriptional regulator with XRE-family HTH domain